MSPPTPSAASSSSSDPFMQRIADAAEAAAVEGATGTTPEPPRTPISAMPNRRPPVLQTPNTHLPVLQTPNTLLQHPKSPGAGDLSPGARLRGSSQVMLAEMAAFLERHPSFASSLKDKLSPSKQWRDGAPTGASLAGWRKYGRRFFYVVVGIALLGCFLYLYRKMQQAKGLSHDGRLDHIETGNGFFLGMKRRMLRSARIRHGPPSKVVDGAAAGRYKVWW